MSDDRAFVLSNAFDLVEAGKPEDARALLEGVIGEGGEEYDNPDAWWIYAHTLADPAEARNALQRILELDPEYPGARDQLNELWRQFPELKPADVSVPEDIPLPPLGDEEPDFVQRVDSTPASQAHLPTIKPLSKAATAEVPTVKSETLKDRPRKRQLLPLLLIAAALILIVVIVFAFLNPFTPPATEIAEIAAQPTDTISAAAAAVTDTVGAVDVSVTEGPQISLTDLALTLSTGQDRTSAGSTETSLMQVTLDVTPEAAAAGTFEGGGGEDTATTLTQESILLVEPTSEPSAEASVEATTAPSLLPTVPAVIPQATPLADRTPETAITNPPTVETTASVTSPANEILLQNLIAAAPELTLADRDSRLEVTSLGDTAIINVCSGYGSQLRQDIDRAMAAVALASVGIENLDAIAVQFTDCTTGAAIRIIGTPIEAAQQFAATNDQLPYNLSWSAL